MAVKNDVYEGDAYDGATRHTSQHPVGCYCEWCRPRRYDPQMTRHEQQTMPQWWNQHVPQTFPVGPRRAAELNEHARTAWTHRHHDQSSLQSRYASGWSSPHYPHYATHIRRMVAQMMPYDPHPDTGRSRSIAYDTTDTLSIYRITGGWPLPGRAPENFPLPWPRAPVAGIPILLAPSLIPNPLHRLRPLVDWDMSTVPSKAMKVLCRRNSKIRHLPLGDHLNQQATSPTCSHMSIMCTFGSLGDFWGPISIQRRVVTVWDVFDAIHAFLNTQLTQSEVDNIKQVQDRMNLPPEARLSAFAQARHRRMEISGRAIDYRRVDCLGERRFFSGLWIGYTADDHWYLNLGVRTRYEARRRSVHFA